MEVKESFSGNLYGRTKLAWKEFFEEQSRRERDRYLGVKDYAQVGGGSAADLSVEVCGCIYPLLDVRFLSQPIRTQAKPKKAQSVRASMSRAHRVVSGRGATVLMRAFGMKIPTRMRRIPIKTSFDFGLGLSVISHPFLCSRSSPAGAWMIRVWRSLAPRRLPEVRKEPRHTAPVGWWKLSHGPSPADQRGGFG